MTDLIQRLEQASAGSRELDARILCLRLGSDWYVKNQYEDGSGKWLCYSKTQFIDKTKQHPKCKAAPHYTTSLDAARSITNWVLLSASDIGADGLALVVLGNPSTTPTLEVNGIHSRLEMAWCIAALKAIEAEKE